MQAGKFGKSVGKAGGLAGSAVLPLAKLGGIVGPLAAAGAFLKLGRDVEAFNRGMQTSIAIMGDVSAAMREQLEAAAIKTARSTIFSSEETAKAFFFLASAGLSVEQSMAGLPVVAQFAQAGMFDLSEATSLLTDAQSALGLKVKDAAKNMQNMTRVGDVLVKANALADATTRQFAEALAGGASRMKLLGVELETGVAILAAFAETGMKAQEAGTALDIVLRELANKAFLNKKAWAEVGISVFDASGKFRDVIGVIAQFEQVLGKMSDEQKIATLEMLGLTNKSNKFILRLVGASEEMEHFRQKLMEAGGTMADVSNKNLTPMQKSLANLGGAWTAFGTAATGGGKLVAIVLDSIAFGLDFLNKLFQGIQLLWIQGWLVIAKSIITVIDLINTAIVGMNKLPGISAPLIPIGAAISIVKGLELTEQDLQRNIESVGEQDVPAAVMAEEDSLNESEKQTKTLEDVLDQLERMMNEPVKLKFE